MSSSSQADNGRPQLLIRRNSLRDVNEQIAEVFGAAFVQLGALPPGWTSRRIRSSTLSS
jgi:hypothetical protein